MNEMIERVAKAIYEADDVWSEAFPWPDMGSKDQSPENYRRIARAAIEAMREPTAAMKMDGAVEFVKHSNAGRAYTSMIDCALR